MVDMELLNAWLADLCSGKHQQARGRMRKDNGYCCLGRLVECANPGVEWITESIDVNGKDYYFYMNNSTDYPYPDECASISEDGVQHRFSTFPDRQLMSSIGLDLEINVTLQVGANDGSNVTFNGKRRIYSILSELNDNGYSFKFIAAVAWSLIKQYVIDPQTRASKQ